MVVAVVEAEVEAVAKARPEHEPRAVHGAKVKHAAEAEEKAKVVLMAGVDREAKADHVAGVEVGTEARRALYEARAESESLCHEVVVVKRAMARAKSQI